MFSVRKIKNFILNSLGILHIPQNFWPWESLTFWYFTQAGNESTSSTSLNKYNNDFMVKKEGAKFM